MYRSRPTDAGPRDLEDDDRLSRSQSHPKAPKPSHSSSSSDEEDLEKKIAPELVQKDSGGSPSQASRASHE